MSQLPVEVASNSRYATQLLPSYGAERDPNAERDPKDDVIGRKVGMREGEVRTVKRGFSGPCKVRQVPQEAEETNNHPIIRRRLGEERGFYQLRI